MAFNPDSYLEKKRAFDPDAYLSRKEVESSSRVPTLAERSVSGLRRLVEYSPLPSTPPKELSRNLLEFEEPTRFLPNIPIIPKRPESAYFQMLPQLESDVATVRKGIPPSLAMLTAPFFPSPVEALTAAGVGMGAGLPFRSSNIRLPRFPLQFPSVAEKGIGTALKGLGKESLSPEIVGRSVQDIYKQRLPLSELTREPIAPLKYTPKTGEQIFKPAYRVVSEQFGKEQVPLSKSGEIIKTARDRKVKNLLSSEKSEWSKISDEHSGQLVDFKNTRNYLESVFNQQGETSSLELLNPQLREAALKTPNPESTAKAILQSGRGLPSFTNVEEGGVVQRTAQLKSGYSVVNKLSDIASNPSNWGAAKTLRSQLGGMIKSWGKRGDELDHILKGAYKSLTEDMQESARQGKFENKVESAFKSSRNFFNYVEKPSSKIIEKTDYSSDILNRLIKTKSPERAKELFTEHDLTNHEIESIRRSLIDEMARSSKNDPKKFSNTLSKYTPETRRAFFGEKTELVDSLMNTVKVLDDEIAKSKVKPFVPKKYTPEDILSKEGLELNRIMEKSHASELVDNILKDRSPEIARTVKSVVGEKGMYFLRRGAINKVLRPSTVKLGKGDKIFADDIAREMKDWSPEFIGEFFGDDAKLVQGIKDSSKTFDELSKESRIGRALPSREGFALQWLKGIFTRYRIPSKVYKMLERTQGKEIEQKILPPKTGFFYNKNVIPASISTSFRLGLPKLNRNED